MANRKKVGVLPFHDCINYGAYWQARCLADGLRSQGHDAVILDHRSWRVDMRELTWGLWPVSPDFIPPLDYLRYARKEWAVCRAISRLRVRAPACRSIRLRDADGSFDQGAEPGGERGG